MQAAITELDFIVRSPYRVELLATLTDGAVHRDEFKERCDASRTTLQRHLDALEERSWIHCTNRTYSLTKQGEAITAQLLEVLDTVRATTRIQPFLRWVPDEAFDLDPRTLADATLVTNDAGDPYALQNRYIDRLREVRQIRALLLATGLRSWKAARNRTLAGELECELVVSPAVARTIRSSPSYKRVIDDVLDSGRHDVFVAAEQLPYFLAIMDDYVQIAVADTNNMPRALVESEHDGVYEWAEQTYETYKHPAEPLSTTVSA